MENEIQPTILVTGFGPFKEHKVNASWEAVKLLEKLFDSWEKSSSVNLIIDEIPVAYNDVAARVKESWEKYKPSIIMHVGVSSIATCLTIECQASSKGYVAPDIHSKCPKEDNLDQVTLKSNCDIEQLCQAVNKNLHETNIKACSSDNAGRYMCEYIYYQSLSIGEPRVIFVHVPDLHIYSSEQTARGLLEIIVHLIECTVGSHEDDNK